jgi:hypothetical protein
MSIALLRITFFFASLGCVATALARDNYPTVAVFDYIHGCMKANGETQTALQSCSCSIDVIASIVPYDRYEAAETFISLGLQTGERGSLFRQGAMSKAAVSELRRAQAEADVRCF